MNPKSIEENPQYSIGIDLNDSDVDGKDLHMFINGFNSNVFLNTNLEDFAAEFGK